jgi:hypothetical protein
MLAKRKVAAQNGDAHIGECRRDGNKQWGVAIAARTMRQNQSLAYPAVLRLMQKSLNVRTFKRDDAHDHSPGSLCRGFNDFSQSGAHCADRVVGPNNPVTGREPPRFVVRNPCLACFILKNERFQGQIDPDGLAVLHQGSAGFRVAENQEFCRAQFHSNFYCRCGMVNASHDRHSASRDGRSKSVGSFLCVPAGCANDQSFSRHAGFS